MATSNEPAELTGEIDVCVAIEHLRAASIKAPAAAKPGLLWAISHTEETLEIIREESTGGQRGADAGRTDGDSDSDNDNEE